MSVQCTQILSLSCARYTCYFRKIIGSSASNEVKEKGITKINYVSISNKLNLTTPSISMNIRFFSRY